MAANERKFLRCAVYTRKSSEHGLEQDFNSLDAQREAAEAYIKSQAHEGWRLLSKPAAKELDRLSARVLRNGATDVPQPPTLPLPRAGTILVREWQGTTHHVTVTDDGFLWNGKPHRSLSSIAGAITGTKWNGPRFFGLRDVRTKASEARNGS